MSKILLLMSTGKSQTDRCRCLNKIHRILSFIITVRTMQRQMCCFGQKWWNPEFGFVPIWNKNLKYQQLCGKTELQFSSNLPRTLLHSRKPWKLGKFFASAQTMVRRTESSKTQKITYLRMLENSDAKLLCPPTRTAVVAATHGLLALLKCLAAPSN